MVNQADVIAAQVFTAKAAILRGSPADLRVALLLLDSTLETLMVRRIEYIVAIHQLEDTGLWWKQSESSIDLNDLDQRRNAENATDSPARLGWNMSKTLRRDIDRGFGSKLKFLVWWGDLPESYLKSASRIHDYRNELAHRDSIRPKSLTLAVHLAAWFSAEFLRRLPTMSVGFGPDASETIGRIYARAGQSHPGGSPLTWLDMGRELPEFIAGHFLDGLEQGLTNASHLLSELVSDRVTRFRRDLEFIREHLVDGESHTDLDLIRRVHAPDDVLTLEGLRAISIPVTRATLEHWNAWPKLLAQSGTPLEAFDSLADFEREFEPVANKVSDLASMIDGEIQFQYDLWRGK